MHIKNIASIVRKFHYRNSNLHIFCSVLILGYNIDFSGTAPLLMRVLTAFSVLMAALSVGIMPLMIVAAWIFYVKN